MKRRIVVIFITVLLASCNQVASPTTTVSALRTPTNMPTQKPTVTPTPTPPLPTDTTEPGEQGYMLADLDMVDDPYGWAVFALAERNYNGQYWLGRTVDGGHTWVNVTPPAYKTIREGWLQFNAIDSETAWAYSTCNPFLTPYSCPSIIWRTVDGGHSWHTLPVILDCRTGKSGCITSRVQFVDEQHGWVEVAMFDRTMVSYRYYRTVDGEAWERMLKLDLGDVHMNAIYTLKFFDQTFGLKYPTWTEQLSIDEIEAGRFNWIEKTLDRGNSWQKVSFPRPAGFTEASVAQGIGEAEKVWVEYSFELLSREPVVVGFRVKFLAVEDAPSFFEIYDVSTDRGWSWQQLSDSGETVFVNATSGWRIADVDSITLEQTTDGGLSWGPFPQDSWQVKWDQEVSTLLHSSDSGANWAEIEPLFIEEELWPGRGLRLESLHMQSAEIGWGVEAGGANVCTSDGARTWKRCSLIEEAEVPVEMYLPDTEGDWSLDEPLPYELFHGGEVPTRLQAMMNDSRQYVQYIDGWSTPFTYSCTTRHVYLLGGGKIGVTRQCKIYYPQGWDSVVFWRDYWLYDYAVLFDGGESSILPNVVSVDYVDERVGWQLLDLQNGFFQLEKTTDGGDAWNAIKTVVWTGEIEFVSALEGWSIARVPPVRGVPNYLFIRDIYREAVLLHTVDGGETWEEMHPVIGP